ncbi:MAG: TonB-dependent receptor [Flavobacteriales bacterium]|jgi:outer membrane receptor protein involved in Fe transport|nr:TonB-dependent receptor [Flavobacteriales bacterium]
MKKTVFSFLIMLVFLSFEAMAQGIVTGKLVDASSGETLIGANVVEKGTSNGVATDAFGKFKLNVSNNNGTLVLSYVGYQDKTVSFALSNGKANMGTVKMSADGKLGEVVLVGKGIIDLAEDRKTPIAVSTITPEIIKAKAANNDLPELIKSTPSVQNVKGGGYGDGQVFLRGFDQTNTAFLLNGQPINGMEDGKMYWSNWSGVMDIANAIQVQRGLGSSKLAISSVGGTVNIVTKTVDTKEGGFIGGMAANNNYMKTNAYYSTGLMDNGLAVSAMLGHWQGDGYIDGTVGQGQTYFLSLGYKPSEEHVFNFLVTGAPQWHGTSRHQTITKFYDADKLGAQSLSDQLQENRRWSNNYGYYKGELYAGGRNFYHKPIVNLSWDWTIDDKKELSVTGYGSLGRGGFAFGSGIDRNSQGLYDYDGAVDAGKGYTKASVNAHNWYGVLANMNIELNDNLELNIGADGRFYNGQHYRVATDFFGVDSISQENRSIGEYAVKNTQGFNPWGSIPFFSDIARKDRMDRNFSEDINYFGAFGQLEYAKDNYSLFLQGAISNQSHQRHGFWGTTKDVLDQGLGDSEKITNLGYNLKLGGAYNVTDQDKVYTNFGYYSRQPFHDDLFVNNNYSNVTNPLTVDQNQEITGIEAGYKHVGDVQVNANVYYTQWDNRVMNGGGIDNDKDGVDDQFSTVGPISQTHYGAELELMSQLTDKLSVSAYLSLGDWRYGSNGVARTVSDDPANAEKYGDTTQIVYLDGVKVGNVAQTTAGIGLNYEVTKELSMNANYNYYADMYGNTTRVEAFINEDHKGAIKLPSYSTVDLGVRYNVELKNGNSIDVNLNVNNVFDKLYIENIRTNNHIETDSEGQWNGVDVSNQVKWGYGRTWNFGVRYNF